MIMTYRGSHYSGGFGLESGIFANVLRGPVKYLNSIISILLYFPQEFDENSHDSGDDSVRDC